MGRMSGRPEDQRQREQQDRGSRGGQVSEVANLGDASPIEPDQATAGSPDDDVQEGTAGPNARPRDDRPGKEPDPDA